ncbi:hypothetical protein M6B38_350780 [Iris pallida]|uniref:Uncharacterized protein n=1 Tax=Iris pallida TaxID=29817 RepID=A0AAX6GRJ4_IRIPA|nr:hypothetical protein M6B38_350780 [Iris pallida]
MVILLLLKIKIVTFYISCTGMFDLGTGTLILRLFWCPSVFWSVLHHFVLFSGYFFMQNKLIPGRISWG